LTDVTRPSLGHEIATKLYKRENIHSDNFLKGGLQMKSRSVSLRLLVYLLFSSLLFLTGCLVDGEIGGLEGEGMKYECTTPVLKCPQKNEPLRVVVLNPQPQNDCYSVKADLKVGDRAYCDKNWAIHTIGYDKLKGSQYIMTRQADNTNPNPKFLQFQPLNAAEGVYVAYDRRAHKKPDWLTSGYTQVRGLSGPRHITIANGDKFIDLELWRRNGFVEQNDAIEIPGNFSGSPSSWPTGFKPGDAAMYMVIVKPKQTEDCSNVNPNNPEKVRGYAYCHNTTVEAEQEAKRLCEAAIQNYPYKHTCSTPSCTTENPCGVDIEVQQMKPTPLSFTRSSEIEFNPSSFKSVANVKIMGKTYTRNVTGTLHFEYVLDGAGRIWEMKVNNMLLKLDPMINTGIGNFTDIVIDLLNPVTATCKNKQSAPWATPCNVYTISPNTFFAGVSTKRGNQTLIYATKNTNLVEIHITDHKKRIFRIAGGPLATVVHVNGKPKDLDIDIDLTGHFLNFAPQALGGESMRVAECAEDKNRDAILLDAGASFEIYNDPIPNSAYKWYEDYGLVTEKFLGQGKRISIAPYQLSYGVHDITLAIRDSHGVTDTDTFEIEVRDKIPPELIVPEDVSILPERPGSVKVNIGQASYSDTCSSDVMITNDAPEGLLFPPGVTQVTWKADDGRGNVAKGIQKVSVFSTGGKMPEGSKIEPSPAVRCDQYANTAISQYMKNMESACGFKGPAWSGNYSNHYEWCMKVPRTQSDAGTKQREDDLANRCAGTQPSQPEGGGTMSGPEVRCDQYTKSAISQNQENISKGCGFGGPRWNSDYNHHYKWCVNVPKQFADFETSERDKEIKGCSGTRSPGLKNEGVPVGPDARCDQYAKTAVSQDRQNMERACGLTGPAWNGNYSNHYDWCVRVAQGQADSGTRRRADDLTNRCAGTQPSQPQGGGTMSGPEVRCDQYAKTAISQNRENMEKACGFTGPAWNDNYNNHYDWCVRVQKEQADAGEKMRSDDLQNKCRRIQ